MTIYIDQHSYHYEMENLVRLFFPNEKIVTASGIPENLSLPCVITSVSNSEGKAVIFTRVCINDFDKQSSTEVNNDDPDFEKTAERAMAVCLYELLCELTGKCQPWGILTGVRPIKLFRRLSEKNGEQYAKDYFEKELLVSKEKTELSAMTEKYERKILALSRPESYSLYVSIPFCPTRCSYCSFVSQTVEKTKKLIQPYFELLCKELVYTAKIVKDCHLRLESVYIGGGTPTTLSAEQLKVLIDTIRINYDMSSCREFTVEAGRPDTIDEEKLQAIYSGGADRISINPQTLNDSVLEVIGRKHTSEQTIKAYELAVKTGFKHINTDLIAGLPTDTLPSFVSTLDRICRLNPASITVHTLALKRSSRLTLQGQGVQTDGAGCAADMLRYCEQKLTGSGYHPYYLYRQTRMEGNLENVGWSAEGFDGIYNVFVMDETHTIIGCGAGAVTKLKVPGGEELSRIFNYKYPYEYISGFDEMLKRKEQVREFYDKLS
ncbi:MAG: coproporphyrinogen dehydrogenase HemZ [Clostridia bacterium]|nr:coproporphyrinogen dehydrogenase HemZ [Clostridia bacterium]